MNCTTRRYCEVYPGYFIKMVGSGRILVWYRYVICGSWIILVLTAFSATRFACDLLVWCPETGAQRERLVSALLPLVLDAVSENLADLVALALERYVGTLDSDKCLALGTHTHSCSLKQYRIPVLRIRNVYPGSRIRLFSIPDPHQRI